MIDYNDVRIGNYVLCNDKVETIYGVSKEYPFLNTIEYGAGVIEWRHIKPINLTDDWLIDLGFEKSNDDFGGWLSIKIIDNDLQTYRIRITNGNFGGYIFTLNQYRFVKIKSVHHLQNLFYSLTGLELLKVYKPQTI